MTISAAAVAELRKKTGAGMMDCKRALEEAAGDPEKATEILRTKGLAELKKRAGKVANEGVIDAYVHGEGRIGVLVEVNCETDFVARNEEFRSFAHDVAMQVAAASPAYVSRDEVPEELVESEKRIYREQALGEGKPEAVVEKIVSGRLEKFYQAVVLLDQPFVKDQDISIEQYLGRVASKLGEKTEIRRFVRFELGETLE